jgi:hypothetical protein
MPVQSTSRFAYTTTNLEREAMCIQLMELYDRGDYTDNEAARILGWHPSQVSARRADLGSVIFNQDQETRVDKYTR